MFQAYRKKQLSQSESSYGHRPKQTTTNWRKQMNKPEGKPSGTSIFKHQDTRYMKYLKEQLDRRETMDKLISVRNDIMEANKRVNYRNQIDRMNNEIQRDNLNHNTLEHLQEQINQFKHLTFS
jgi:hypothetical protein